MNFKTYLFCIFCFQKVKNFGVFSCGPPAMTGSVEKACSKLNQYKGASYNHHFENF